MAAILRAARAPSGTDISCIGWQKVPALRMLMYNPDRGVALAPDELIGFGRSGRAAFGREPLDAISRALHCRAEVQSMPALSRKPRSQRVCLPPVRFATPTPAARRASRRPARRASTYQWWTHEQ